MRAVLHRSYGNADVLEVGRVARPPVGDGDVLVRVHAAGLDRGVWHVMTGKPYLGRLAFGLRRPKAQLLGFDLAGTVEAVGSRVTRFGVGDEVFGSGSGALAEFAVAPEDRLIRKPAALTFERAAVVATSGATALRGLEVGRVDAGQRVLVTGASGGVGSFAVQLAKAAGAEVTAAASTPKLDLVRALGADHVLDHTTDDFADGASEYDLILDIAGNPTVSRLRRALAPRGTAVIVGGEEGGPFSGGLNRQLAAMATSVFVRQRLTMIFAVVQTADLEKLAGHIEAGTLVPSLDRTFAKDDAPEAMRLLEAGAVRGKVAVTF